MHRVIRVLHHWEGLSYAEVARFLEAPVGTVMSRLHRYAGTRRYLVDEDLMRREGGVYEFTPPGEAVWRVERFLQERNMQ